MAVREKRQQRGRYGAKFASAGNQMKQDMISKKRCFFFCYVGGTRVPNTLSNIFYLLARIFNQQLHVKPTTRTTRARATLSRCYGPHKGRHRVEQTKQEEEEQERKSRKQTLAGCLKDRASQYTCSVHPVLAPLYLKQGGLKLSNSTTEAIAPVCSRAGGYK